MALDKEALLKISRAKLAVAEVLESVIEHLPKGGQSKRAVRVITEAQLHLLNSNPVKVSERVASGKK